LAEAEPREVLLDATSRILQAFSKRRVSEAVRWLTDLMYYASMKDLDEQYLKLFDRVIREVEKQPESFRVRFAESLNTTLDRMKRGSEAFYLHETLAKAEKLKMERLEEYITPPAEFKRRASRILREVLGG
jgi:hypothetical protein